MASALLLCILFFCSNYHILHASIPNTIRNAELTNLYRNDPLKKRHETPAVLLQQIFSYFTDDDIRLLQNSTESQCMNIGNMYDIDQWKNQYDNNPSFKQLLHQKQAIVRADCENMNLSDACFEDCLYYNDVFSWITALFDNSTNQTKEVTYMITLYALSAGPFSYYDAGNPSMCTYEYGTYCYTPAIATGFPLMEHACCLPGSCVGDDAVRVLNSNTWCYQEYHSIYGNIPGVDVLNICESMPREFNKPGPIIVIAIFIIFVLLVAIASVIKQYYDEIQYNITSLWVSCFNIQDIWKSFKSVRPKGKRQYNFLDGIRVWSMSWVIFGHSFLFFVMSGSSNTSTMIPGQGSRTDYKYVIQKLYMLLAEYGFYSVDSFFFLSGFLAAFSIYRLLQKYSKRKVQDEFYLWIPLAYLSRLLRIVPMMMYATAIQWQLSDQISCGYHVTSRSLYTDYCDDGWYMVLFFYANLYLSKNHGEAINCMGHLWYIQCDMQFFLFLPWIMLLFKMDKIVGFIASIIPIIICLGIRIFYAFYYDFGANELYPAYPTKNGGDYNDDSYFKPWTRMAVYFIGVAAMLLFIMIDEEHKRKKQKYVLSKTVYFSCVFFSCFILCSLVFWPYQDVVHAPDERWSLFSNQIYYALSRPAWGFALALLSFAFKYKSTDDGQKSMIKTILSAEIYQPLGKLTYSMYLLHLIIYAWWALDLEQALYYDVWQEVLLYLAIWMITAVFSVILWFFMEKPIANLTTALLKSISGQNKPNVNARSYQILDEGSKQFNLSREPSVNDKNSQLSYFNEQTSKHTSHIESFGDEK